MVLPHHFRRSATRLVRRAGLCFAITSMSIGTALAADRSSLLTTVPKVCFEQQNTCNHACMSNPPRTPAYVECVRQCSIAFQDCKIDGGPTKAVDGSTDASGTSDPEGTPEVASPNGALTALEVRKLVTRMGVAAERRQPMMLPQVEPPECQKAQFGMIRDPAGCLMARTKPRTDALAAEQTQVPALLAQVERSLDIEVAALPPDPLARVEAIQEVNAKYRPVTSYANGLREDRITRRNPNDPILVGAARFESKRVDATLRTYRLPEVKQAWIEGRVKGDLPLPYPEKFEWGMDRKTWVMQAELRQQGKRSLFSDRTSDLRQSSREASDAGGYARWGEPTTDEIGLAILRVLVVTGGSQPTSFESARVPPTPAIASLLNMEMALVNRLIHIEKERCSKVEGGYRCTVRQWIQTFPRGPGVAMFSDGRSAPLAMLYKAALDASEQTNGTPSTVFVKATSGGWQAPELVQLVRDSDERIYAAANRRVAAARCSARKERDSWAYLSADCQAS